MTKLKEFFQKVFKSSNVTSKKITSKEFAEKLKSRYDSDNLKGYLADTNTLLNKPHLLKKYDNLFIPSHVLREIEHLELTRRSDRRLQAEIREFKRMEEENFEQYIDLEDFEYNLREEWSKDYTDNLLVQIALEKNLGMITNDRLLRKKCRLYGIKVVTDDTEEFEDNKGFLDIKMSKETLDKIYLSLDENTFELAVNEYLIARNSNDEVMDILKWTGAYMVSLRNSRNGKLTKTFTTDMFSTFRTKDEYQVMAVDSILNNQVTVIRGNAGSGKSYIALNAAWNLVEKEGYKLYIFTNPAPAKDSVELGFYKGDKDEKLLQSSVGNMLKSKFGDEQGIMDEINRGNLEILPFVDLRGFDTGEKAIVWIVEAQNLTSELMKMGLQRVSESSKVIIDGDYHLQLDQAVYEIENGMKRVSEVFRGQDLYGEIELQKVYRSRLADMAEAM